MNTAKRIPIALAAYALLASVLRCIPCRSSAIFGARG
jgi:hypothetical protein